jgi:HD-like signal output (HDOD) protein
MSLLIGSGLPLAAFFCAGMAWWLWRRRRAPSMPSQVPQHRYAPARADPAEQGEDAPGRAWALPLVAAAAAATGSSETGDGDAIQAAVARTLSRFASERQRLPRRPQLLPQLLGTLNDDAASLGEIAALIGRDPTLAAGLLKLANSPLYRLQPAPVESLDRAVALVGTQGLRRLVAVALMQPVMRTDGGVLGRLPEVLWEHTQHAAVVAARHAQSLGEDAFAAQLLALLQGLGAIVMMQAVRETCEQRAVAAPPAVVTACLLEHWSPRIGRLVAQEWELSSRLLDALDEQSAADLSTMSGLGRSLALAAPAATQAILAPTPA